MPAAVKTNNFMLGQATLMIAPFAQAASNIAFDLSPATHSVGLVKNVTMAEESDQVELRSGVKQTLVDSQKSGVRLTISAEVYEYTGANLMYALSLNQTVATPKAALLAAAPSTGGGATTIDLDPAVSPSSSYDAALITVGDLTAGKTLVVRGINNTDEIWVTQVQSGTLGACVCEPPLPASMTDIAAGNGAVYLVNEVPIGTTDNQDYFSVKIAGTLANEDKPLVAVYPKCKISKGFNLSFTEDNYGSMPFEISPYLLTRADVGAAGVAPMMELVGLKAYGRAFLPA